MTDDKYNGSTALVKKMETLLQEKKLSTSAAVRLMLEKDLADIKADHERDLILSDLVKRQAILESHDIVKRIKDHPKLSFAFFVLFLILNSMVNWSGIRKPAIQAVVYQVFGILIPLDSIP